MGPAVYVDRGTVTSPLWSEAFAAGSGGYVTDELVLHPCTMALWGSGRYWPLLMEQRRKGRDWYYGDHGYFGRGSFYRCTRNGFQHDGIGESDGKRFAAFGLSVRPWRKKGSHVLICLQDPSYMALRGLDRDQWLGLVEPRIRRVTDRQIRVRSHVITDKRPLMHDLKDCWAVVTYTSNAAVEALLSGIPVFCLGECPALRMGTADLSYIEYPRMPDGREQLMGNLADNQWTLEEYRSGMAWERLSGID